MVYFSDKLLDYIENFILYENKREKIIAKNHQFLGLIMQLKALKIETNCWKLGVFGIPKVGKLSMGMFVNKINRKLYAFYQITDRRDLFDRYIKTFKNKLLQKKTVQPKDSED